MNIVIYLHHIGTYHTCNQAVRLSVLSFTTEEKSYLKIVLRHLWGILLLSFASMKNPAFTVAAVDINAVVCCVGDSSCVTDGRTTCCDLDGARFAN